jgi:tetratricopeptide (TPR) repeat protein
MGDVKILKPLFITLSALVLFIYLLASPPHTCAVESIYTIQTGSYDREATARKAFNALTQQLTEKELDNLRIEKIGRFYSVRLGKYGRRDDAYTFYGTVKDVLQDAIVMNAYYKPERIVSLYASSPSADVRRAAPEEPLPPPVSSQGEYGNDAKPPLVMAKKTGVPTLKEVIISSPEDEVKKISGLVKKEDYEGALKLIVTGIRKRPDNHELYAWYGAVLLKTDRPSPAITYYKKAIDLSPGVSDYHSGAGYSLLFVNRADDSIAYFSRALEIEPEHMDALFGLATAYAKSGDNEKAFEVYSRVLLLDREAAQKLGEIIKSGS